MQKEEKESNVILVAKKRMEINNKVLLNRTKRTPFKIRPQVVNPTETTTLSTPLQSCIFCYITPTPSVFTIPIHVFLQLLVFFRRPQSFLYFLILLLLLIRCTVSHHFFFISLISSFVIHNLYLVFFL